MKTILRNTKLVMILAFLPALLSAAQVQAVDYKNNYRGVQRTEYRVQTVSSTAPAATFQSTSAYSGQWAPQESTTPMLNSDGTVNDGAYMGSSKRPGIRRTETNINNPGDPDDEEDEGNVPLGEGLLALMFLACAYAISKVSRRRRILRG